MPVPQRYISHHRLVSSSSSGDGGYVQYLDDDPNFTATVTPIIKTQPFIKKQALLNCPPPDPSSNQMMPNDLLSLRKEIEKSRCFEIFVYKNSRKLSPEKIRKNE